MDLTRLPIDRHGYSSLRGIALGILFLALPVRAGAQSGPEAPSPPVPIRQVYSSIFFAADSDLFLATEYARLEIMVGELKHLPLNRIIIVEGHCSANDRFAGKTDLSLLRAQRLTEALMSRGLTHCILFRGLGYSKPLTGSLTNESHILNRRAEIIILNAGDPLL